MKLIKILKKLKYIRTPCRKCLVQPICKDKCNKLENHYELHDLIGDHLSSIMFSIEVFLITLAITMFLVMRS